MDVSGKHVIVSKREQRKLIRNAVTESRLEGIPVPEESIRRLRSYVSGEMSESEYMVDVKRSVGL